MVRKSGACVHFSPNKVVTICFERTINTIVAGTRTSDAYFSEDAKAICSSSFSFSVFIFEKTGKSTVDIGMVKNVSMVANWVAT